MRRTDITRAVKSRSRKQRHKKLAYVIQMYTVLNLKKEIRIKYTRHHTENWIVKEYFPELLESFKLLKKDVKASCGNFLYKFNALQACVPIEKFAYSIISFSILLIQIYNRTVVCVRIMTIRSTEFPVIYGATTLRFYHDINGMSFLAVTRNYETHRERRK